MLLSRRSAWALVLAGVFQWLVWPGFLRNIWQDERSWDAGPTSFFLVHLVLTAASLGVGLVVGAIGVRGLRGTPAPVRREREPAR
ncbi:SCO4848 family membrane protein [Vallicoccus soli]|uniref:Integral membrane protein n=1 Tax=Vallicoccus soli TaxID=2339232 RepID=A0A3A3YYY8_9ACTN|nr:hypothetical protein [Vallicoccus soli]RJK95279.1 hypothetical protein D5H78_11440 [Vallicoccus soli]